MSTASFPAEGSDREEFLARFLAVQPSLRSYLHALAGPQSDADDLMQEVSLTLWREYARYDRERPFIAWAIGIARNHAARWRRDGVRRHRRLSEQAEAALAVAYEELEDELSDRRSALGECLDRLGAQARQLVVMRYQEGLDLAAIAQRKDSSVNAINKAMGKIRRLLMDCMGRTEALP